jgi:tellurite resistance protein TerC
VPTLPIVQASAAASGPAAGFAAWITLAATIAVLLTIDLLILRGRGGTMSNRAAAITSIVWVALSLGFAAALTVTMSSAHASAFLAGYAVEKSLSLDNVFVFLVVLQAFAIAETTRARILTYGIVLALALRLIFILLGATALHHAAWLSIPFAAVLLWTGWRLWRSRHDHGGEAALVDGIRRRLRVVDGDHGDRLLVRSGGRFALTVTGAAFLSIAAVDLLFAVDSVPAILAITTDTYVVFAANAFALLGLRPLFFLVAHLVERLYYLKSALAFLLVFIGVKMGLSEFVGKLPPAYSLLGVATILSVGVGASLVHDRRIRNRQDDDRAA